MRERVENAPRQPNRTRLVGSAHSTRSACGMLRREAERTSTSVPAIRRSMTPMTSSAWSSAAFIKEEGSAVTLGVRLARFSVTHFAGQERDEESLGRNGRNGSFTPEVEAGRPDLRGVPADACGTRKAVDFDDLLRAHDRNCFANRPRTWPRPTRRVAEHLAGRRVPGHQPASVPADSPTLSAVHGNVFVGRRRGPEHLSFPRRRNPQHPRVRSATHDGNLRRSGSNRTTARAARFSARRVR